MFDPSKYGAVRVDETTQPTTTFDPTKYGAVRVDETPTVPTVPTTQKTENGRSVPADIAVGVGKGALSTIVGASSLGEKILNSFWKTVLPKSAEKALGIDKAPTLGILKKSADVKTSAKQVQSEKEQKLGLKEGQLTTPQNTAQKVGFYGEQIGEFLIPGSASTKLGKAAKLATKGSKTAELGVRVLGEASIAGGQTAIQQGGIDKETGAVALTAGAFPIAGKALSSVVKPVASKASEGVMNSLIKPLMRDLQYEKNPSKGLLKYVGSFNSYEDALKKTDDALSKLSEQKSNIIKNPILNSEKLSFGDDIDKIFKEAQQKAKYDENALKRLQAAKENVLYDVSVDSTGNKILGAKRDLNNLTVQEANNIQREIGEMRTWLGFAKEEQASDKALGRIYGTIKQKTNKLADDYGIKLDEINEGISNLVTAKKVLKHRDEVLKRQNIFSMPSKLATYGLGAIGVASLNPLAIIGAVGLGGIDKLLGSASFKTRLAKTLANLGAKERSALVNKTPGLSQVFNRIFGENLPETFDEQKIIKKIDEYLKKQPKNKLLPVGTTKVPKVSSITTPKRTNPNILPYTNKIEPRAKVVGTTPRKPEYVAFEKALQKEKSAVPLLPQSKTNTPRSWVNSGPTINLPAKMPRLQGQVVSPSDLRTNPIIEKAPKKSLPIKKNEVLNTLNPTGGVFVDYTPQKRATMKLGENMTTLDKTMGKTADEIITIYRGTGKGNKIVPGDFITTNKQLAQDYAGTGKILEKKVKLSDVLDDKTEPLGEEYIYRPKANKKAR